MVRFEFRPYDRSFRQPLRTHYGDWKSRQGIILRLTTVDGLVSWGEIAPIEAFGSESWEQALHFCQNLPFEISVAEISQIPSQFPACRFGFESAWEMLVCPKPDERLSQPLIYSDLLPTGPAALQSWSERWKTGKRTFKWKIGVAPIAEEFAVFEQLIEALPDGSRLRLDANGGLDWQAACQWLQKCDRHPVEFLEQPLPPNQFEQMLKLSYQYATPIALDESVSNVDQLETCYQKGWRGIFVIKAAIAGSPQRLRTFCQEQAIDVVWSSVFETAIAQRFICDRLIALLPPSPRAVGFGVHHWFVNSSLNTSLDQPDFEQLWQSL